LEGAPPGGFLFALLGESFAVRALLGSLAAVAVAALALRLSVIRSTGARRLLLLAPVLTAAAAGFATAREAAAFLPRLSVPAVNSSAGQLVDFIDDFRLVELVELDLISVAYAIVVTALLSRRIFGVLAVRRLLRLGAVPQGPTLWLEDRLEQLAVNLGLARPVRLLLVPACPGGAFAAGVRRPVVALDPALVEALDTRELEGLLAHELAHLRRHDPLLCAVVGVFRDLTFFLPPVALAARWLRSEQEESADEVAARLTARPASLASSILKVWDRAVPASPQIACAAVGVRLRLAGGPGGSHSQSPLAGHQVLTRRVERLIAGHRDVPLRRRQMELAFAAAVVAAATAGAIAVPEDVALGFAYLPEVPETANESEVFATFHYLTLEAQEAEKAEVKTTTVAGSTTAAGYPLVESVWQLREQQAASQPAASQRLLWADDEQAAHEVREPRPEDAARARALWTLPESGPRVGVFLVAQPA